MAQKRKQSKGKKPAVKKAAVKKPARKAAAKKSAGRAAPKKTSAKKAGGRTAPKKAAAKKAAPRKGAAKKPAARAAPKKAAPGKAEPKKPAAATRSEVVKFTAPARAVTVMHPPQHSLEAPPALGEGEVEVSGVYGTIRYNENDPYAEVKEIFSHYDRNKSGVIEAKEFARICEALGMEMEEHEAKVALLTVDQDGDQKISWEEFLGWWKSMRG